MTRKTKQSEETGFKSRVKIIEVIENLRKQKKKKKKNETREDLGKMKC